MAIEKRPARDGTEDARCDIVKETLTQNQLARLLKSLGIAPEKIGLGKERLNVISAPTSKRPSAAI